MAITDPIQEGINAGWKLVDANTLKDNTTVEADVLIIGTGAGGGVTAEQLSLAGYKVVMLEEGGLFSSKDFDLDELTAYGRLYQEAAARTSKDGSISILQGRAVGGTTVVNWTSSFRTPPQTLEHWQQHYQLQDYSQQQMTPYFEKMEQRLNIEKWALPPNANNDLLKLGCEKNGFSWSVIPRNVKGCWDLGYCGMGCPTNAKQSMLVTTLPSALQNKAEIYYRASARKIHFDSNQATEVDVVPMNPDDGFTPEAKTLKFKAKHIVLAAGAMNTPALMLRSQLPDPNDRIGKGTTLHVVNASVANYAQKIDPFYGAPQSIYSDHFQWSNPEDEVGFKLEVAPMHPSLSSQVLLSHGEELKKAMGKLDRMQGMIALTRDGFDERCPGGSVELDDRGNPVLDYPVTDYMWKGLWTAFTKMAEIQFAAGATEVMPIHHDAKPFKTLNEAKAAIQDLPKALFRTRLMCAHVMGGCAFGENLEKTVVNSQGKFHLLDNLWVIDGSVFPTSIGANPQLSIYGMALRQSEHLIRALKG